MIFYQFNLGREEMKKGICLEFYNGKVAVSTVPKMVSSNLEFGFSEFILADCDFPKKAEIHLRLQFSPERNQYYLKVVIPAYLHEQIFYLQCEKKVADYFGYLPKDIDSRALDNIIKNFRPSAHFAHDNKMSLELFLLAGDKTPLPFELACNEELIDSVFIINPGIITLIEEINKWMDYPLIKKIHYHLKIGFIDPAREIMILERNALGGDFPKEVKERLIHELFTKREILWNYS